MDDTIRLLRDLVAIDSVNPSLVPGGAGEKNIADAVAAELRKTGMDVQIQQAEADRPNVIGILEGRSPGRSLMLCGHLDTVGVAGMSAPFDPVERDGKLYGRGAQDMKGGVAAMISVAQKLASSGGLNSGSLILAAVADEEYASIGASALVTSYKADAAVVLEPSDLVIGVAHKGFSWVEIITEGIAAHGSRPADGKDAILAMGQVLSKLREQDRALQTRKPHPLLGTGSLHASLITGGRELSTYPDRCILQMERRTIAGESMDTALHEVENLLSSLQNEDPNFSANAKFLFGQPPYELPSGHDLPDRIEAEMAGIGRTTKRAGMTFWTDAAILGQAGIPSVVFGPGGAGLHGLVEYVHIEEMLLCRDILVNVAREFCSRGTSQ